MFKKLISKKAILIAFILMLFVAIPSSFAEDSSAIDFADNSSSIEVSAVDARINIDENNYNDYNDINGLNTNEFDSALNADSGSDLNADSGSDLNADSGSDLNELDSNPIKEDKTNLNSNQLSASPWTIEETGLSYDNLTEAINAAASGNTIVGAAGTVDTLDNITISKDITIKALNKGDVQLSPSNSLTRLFYLNSGNLNLINLEFKNFNVSGSYSSSETRIDGCIVYSYGGNLNAENCAFSSIDARNSYGSIFDFDKGNLYITNCHFEDIHSYGAAILVNSYSQSETVMKDSTFKAMTSTTYADVVYAFSSDLTIDNCSFLDSQTSESQIFSQKNVLYVKNSLFKNLTSSNVVAAVEISSMNTYAEIDNCTFDSCVSSFSPSVSGSRIATGAIYSQSTYANISNSLFTNCRASGQYSYSQYSFMATAGAVVLDDGEFNYCAFINNSNNPNNRIQYEDICAFGLVDANNCYWASNSQPNSSKFCNNVTADSWYILTLDTNGDVLTGQNKEIFFNLNSVNNTNGVISESKPLKDLNLTVNYTLSNSEASRLNIVNGQGSINYVSQDKGDETLKVTPGDTEFGFTVLADALTSIYVSNSGSDSNPGSYDSPYKTIEYALSQVTDTRNIIYIEEGIYKEHDLTLTKDVSIIPLGLVIIDAEENGRIFNVLNEINLTLKDMTLQNGKSDDYGGAISFKGNLTLINVTVKDSHSANGGAIYCNGSIYVSQSNFINNTALANGGAVYIEPGLNNYIVSSKFINNTGSFGGAIYCEAALELLSNDFENNTGTYGGAVYLETSSNALIDRNTFRANNASNDGGAIYFKSNDESKVYKIINNVFIRNKAQTGGSVYLSYLTAILKNNSMSAYHSADGGLVYLDNAKANVLITVLDNGTLSCYLNRPVNITAKITDDQDNLINGGIFNFKISGGEYGSSFVELGSASIVDGIASYEFTLNDETAEEFLVGGNYSCGSVNATLKTGKLHTEMKHWFIEGGDSYEYLADAVANAHSGDVIYGTAGNYTVDTINIDKKLTIKGLTKNSVILNGNDARIFNLTKNYNTVNLINLTLANGASTGNGGLIQINGTLNLVNSTLMDTGIAGSNSEGGAIYAFQNSILNIESSLFKNISSNYIGGAISVLGQDSILNIKDSEFINITGKSSGAAIFCDGETNINGTNFTDISGPFYLGTYSFYAAAVYVNNNLNIDNSRFINTTGLRSSAIYLANESSIMNIQHSVFINNSASGTTIWSKGMKNTVNYCIFANNFAESNCWDFIGDGYYLESNDLEYNYWESNEKPLYNYNWNLTEVTNWVILDLSTDNQVLIAGTNNDVYVDFSKYTNDGNSTYDLEDSMPSFVFDLSANTGTIDSTVSVENGHGLANYLAPNENTHVIVEIEPGDEILEFDIIKSESFIFVANNGSDLSGDGSLLRPYQHIEYALTKVTDVKNIIYVSAGSYNEHDLIINKSVTIQGQNTKDVIIDAQGEGRIFTVLNGAQNVEIKAVALTNGESDIAGAVYSESYNFTMYDTVISSTKTTDGGALTLNGFSSIYNNEFLDIEGNASIYLYGGITNLTNNIMENVPSNAIYVDNGVLNAKIVYLNGSTIEVPKLQDASLTATVTDDMGNPIGGGMLEFKTNAGSIGEAPVDEGKASIVFTAPNREVLYTLSGSFSNGVTGTIIKSGQIRVIKLGFYINDTGYETLHQAVTAAGDGDTIIAVPGSYNVTLETIQKDLTIKANESDSVVLRVSGRYFLDVFGEYTLNLEGLIMEDAKEYQGFFIYDELGTVNIDNCTFRNASGETVFAVVTVESGVLNVKNSNFENIHLLDASTSEWGGAIYGFGGSEINIEDSRFTNNGAGSYGGAIALSNTKLTVRNSTFIDNYARFRGGAIYNSGGAIALVENCTFINNSALGATSSYGGAICSESANIDVFKSVFVGNNAAGKGGAIYDARNSTINYNIFMNNTAANDNYGNDIYFNWYKGTYPDEYIDLSYNYWGTNDGPGTANIGLYENDSTVCMDKWTILQGYANASNVTYGPEYTITLDLSQYKYGDEILDLDEEMPNLDIQLTPSIGKVNPQSTVIEGGKANVTYSTLATGDEIIYLSNSDQTIRFTVEFGADYFLIANVTSLAIDLGESKLINISVLDNFRNPSNGLNGKDVVITAYEMLDGARSSPVSLPAKTINKGSLSFNLNEFNGFKAGSLYEIIFAVDDDFYDIETSIISLQINKMPTVIDADDGTVFVGSGNISIALIAHDNVLATDSPLSNKEIVVRICDDTYIALSKLLTTNDEGIAIINTKDIPSGIYTVDVAFNGDEENSPSNKTFALNVSKIATSIIADDINESLGKAVLKVDLVSLDGEIQYNKDLNVTIMDMEGNSLNSTSLKTSGDLISFDLSEFDLEIGQYIANISFAGDDKYESSSKEVNINIYNLNLLLKADDITVNQGSGILEIQFTTNGNPIASKLISIEIGDDNLRSVTNAEGIVKVDLSDLVPGEYTAIFSFAGDSDYPSIYNISNVVVLSVPINDTNDTNGTNGTGDNGTDVNDTNGTNGTDTNITEQKSTITTINIDSSSVNVNETVIITPSVICEDGLLKGTVDIIINDKLAATVDIGSAFEFTPSSSGNYDIYASFIASENYEASASSIVSLTVNDIGPVDNVTNGTNDTNGTNGTDANLTVPKATVSVVGLNSTYIKVNETVIISPSVVSDDGLIEGSVDIIVNGEKLVTIDIGKTYEFVPNASGSYDISASFAGSGDYGASISDIVSLTVLDASPIENGTNDTNGTDVNGSDKNDTRPVKDGKALQELIDNAAPGSTLDLGSAIYENVSDIKINKDIKLLGDNTTIVSENDGNPVFIIDSVDNGVEDVSISGIEFVLSNGDTLAKAKAVNGSSPLSIDSPKIQIVNNTITAADGAVAESITVLELEAERGVLAPTREISVASNNIDSGIKTFDFKVSELFNSTEANINEGGNIPEKIATIINYKDMTAVSVDSNVDGRVGEYFKITLVDSNGKFLANKAVQIGFNGAIYNRTTDENGSAKLQINLKKVSLYTFAVCFLGDDLYNSSFIVAKINVTAQKAKLTTTKKTYKASAKTKTLTATLKSAKGNPMANKKVTFTVNGKTYTAKTNSKGLASVKVSLSKKGSYSFTVKYAGDYGFAAVSTSNKVVIK